LFALVTVGGRIRSIGSGRWSTSGRMGAGSGLEPWANTATQSSGADQRASPVIDGSSSRSTDRYPRGCSSGTRATIGPYDVGRALAGARAVIGDAW